MGKRKRHRVIDPAKARVAAGGRIGWHDRIIPAQKTLVACSKCGTRTSMIGPDGECLRCRLERRKAASSPEEGSPT